MATKARSSSFAAVVENAGVATEDFAVDWSLNACASMARPEETIGLTVCVNADEVLPAKFASPEYLAVMECEPTASEEIASCALEFDKLEVPRAVAPSKKITVPVGPLPEEI